jgi:hypothetical protein
MSKNIKMQIEATYDTMHVRVSIGDTSVLQTEQEARSFSLKIRDAIMGIGPTRRELSGENKAVKTLPDALPPKLILLSE